MIRYSCVIKMVDAWLLSTLFRRKELLISTRGSPSSSSASKIMRSIVLRFLLRFLAFDQFNPKSFEEKKLAAVVAKSGSPTLGTTSSDYFCSFLLSTRVVSFLRSRGVIFMTSRHRGTTPCESFLFRLIVLDMVISEDSLSSLASSNTLSMQL